MKKFMEKVFGGLNINWVKLIIFAIIMGVYTALMAMFAPDGSSFHDIAVTFEWWVLPAILIIVNSKSPLDAACKTFVFFLISQPLVYLIQVPFNEMGWGLFGYYRYWFLITLLTFPGAYLGWFIKKKKWYAGVILSVMTALLVFLGIGFVRQTVQNFPNHLLTTIYCFGIVPILIFGILKDKWAKIIAVVVSLITLVLVGFVWTAEKYETYNNTFLNENGIVLSGEAAVSSVSGSGDFKAELNKTDVGYVLKVSGEKGKKYHFTITDDNNEYDFEYYYDNDAKSVVIKRV